MMHIKKISVTFMLVVLSVDVSAEAVSGYEFIKPETQAMQDDDFENPGLLAVDHGRDLFNQKHEKEKACADCHGEEGESFNKKRLARYPMYKNRTKK